VSGIATGEGSVWLASFRDSTVYRVDPKTMRGTPIALPEPPLEIAVGAGGVWVTTPTTLVRIDPVTGEIVDRIRLGRCDNVRCRTDVVVADGTVWATHYDGDSLNGRLIRLDPTRAGSERSIPLGARPVALTVGAGAVWILHDDNVDIFWVERIDIEADTRSPVEFPFEASGPVQCLEPDVGSASAAEPCAAISLGQRAVWVITPGDGASLLWRLDLDDGQLMSDQAVEIACCATTLVGTEDLVDTILLGGSFGDILEVPEVEGVPTNDVLTIGAPVTDIAIGYGAMWVSVDGPRASN